MSATPRFDFASIAEMKHTDPSLHDAQEVLRIQLKFQSLVAEISRQLLNLSFNELDAGMVQALASLGSVAAVGRAYMFLLSADGERIDNAYEWCAPEVEGHDFESFRGISVDNFPWSMKQFLASHTVYVRDPELLPPDATPERQACLALSIKSYVNMPMFVGGQLVGWLGFDSTRERREWTDEQLKLMELAGDILINALDRKRRDELHFKDIKWAHVTLQSIGDAVITTDAAGGIEYLNPVAESLTGWSAHAARGQILRDVFHIVNEDTGESLPDFAASCLREGRFIESSTHTVLVSRTGKHYAIQGSAAPISGRNREVLGAALVFRDVTESRRLAQQLVHQANHDALTELVNRREFERRLDHAIESVREHATQCVLCFLDLDRFKLVNDTAGHAAGDELLKQVASLFKSRMRSRDTLARIGGDEFSLLLEGCPVDNAVDVANSLIQALREHRFSWNNRSYQIGVSIGVVPVTDDVVSSTQLLSRADLACYTAKELGRNRIQLYQTEDRAMVQRHAELAHVAMLRGALEKNQFAIFCQPILPLSTGSGAPLHHEILLRLMGSKGELIPPGIFIPAAERYGLMSSIDRWVIEKVLRHYECQFNGSYKPRLSINLSGNSFGDGSLLDFISQQLNATGVPPDRVCFEITETAVIQHLPQATRFMSELKTVGCEFALDDFGSGLCSFTYLKQLPVDYLKIDGSFVRNMVEDQTDREMVAVINHIGHTMGHRTIAECAESPDVIAILREMGVDHVQGFAVSPPIPLGEIIGICTPQT